MRCGKILRLFFWGITLLLGCSDNYSKDLNSSHKRGIESPTKDTLSSITMSKKLGNEELTKIYTQAIQDFILQVNKEYSLSFDTLFFGKHIAGQEDDFPDIQLPPRIGQTEIRLISPEEGMVKQRQTPSSYYINMMGWVDQQKASFIMVVFSNGMAHQLDDYLDYAYQPDEKNYRLTNYRFENFLYKRN